MQFRKSALYRIRVYPAISGFSADGFLGNISKLDNFVSWIAA